MVRRVDERGALADVRGDSGVLRRVLWDAHAELRSCECEASSRCAYPRCRRGRGRGDAAVNKRGHQQRQSKRDEPSTTDDSIDT